jgi:MAGUK p55 subfamily protein 5
VEKFGEEKLKATILRKIMLLLVRLILQTVDVFQCMDILEKWQSSSTATGVGGAETIAAVQELMRILATHNMEALLLAHDSIVAYVDGLQRKQSPSSSPPSDPPSPTSSWKDSRVVDNIKIIRIEKTNEPLGATVRNEGDAVIIGEEIKMRN